MPIGIDHQMGRPVAQAHAATTNPGKRLQIREIWRNLTWSPSRMKSDNRMMLEVVSVQALGSASECIVLQGHCLEITNARETRAAGSTATAKYPILKLQ